MKKRWTAAAAAVILLTAGFSALAAEREIEPLQVMVSEYSDYRNVEETNWVYYTVPDISLEEEGYPELSAVLDQYTAEERKAGEAAMDQYAEYLEADLDMIEEYTDYYSESKAQVVRADSRIFSMVETRSSYAGGAHPNYWYVTHTWDSTSGKELLLTDILQDPDSLPETLEAALLKDRDAEEFLFPELADAIREEMNVSGTEDGEAETRNPGPYFTLGNDNITFWFAPYELTSYAAGGIVQTLYFSDYPDLVKPEYTECASSWIVPVPQSTVIRLPESGMDFSWNADPLDEYATEFTFSMKAGGASREEKIYAYELDGSLMHRDGKDFFACRFVMEDGYNQTHIYRLEPKDGTMAITETDWIGRRFESACPTDPEEFVMSGSADLLSTYRVKRKYSLDEAGNLKPLEDWDTIIDWSIESEEDDYQMVITPKTDLEADAVDPESGEITGKMTVPAGEKLRFIRTDCQTWVDMRLTDGSAVRLYVTSDWPQEINGVPAENIFDGMRFAG